MIRGLARKLLRRAGIGVWAIDTGEILNFENLLFGVLAREGGLKYVQVGGNDGILADPMYEFLRRHSNSVSGLVVEPLPHLFAALEQNYQNFSGVRLRKVAIHASKNEMQMYYVDPRKITKANSHLAGIASFDPDHWKRTGLVTADQILSQPVPCRPLMDVISEESLEDMDVFITDTEGYDFHVLSALDLDRTRPSVVRFEHGLKNSLMTRSQFNQVVEKLTNFGYHVIKEDYDATAIRLH
jgi:FkbM family methyltransferase